MRKNILNKEIKNASWLIGGRIIQMIISLFVGILTARYLGPNNYGLINYGLAYVTFFTSVCNLGINSIIIKNFVDHPEEQGITIGTTLFLRIFSSILSNFLILCLVLIVDNGELSTVIVTLLCSLSLIFQSFDTLNYWFQSRYQSKITSLATLFAYIIVSVYRIILLINNCSIYWFALANSVDYLFIALFLLTVYKYNCGPKLKFSFDKARQLLSSSYHYILSGMMVAIYGQTDKLMLKQMIGQGEVGYYSVATTICNLWIFILTAIIDSMYPTIMNFYGKDKAAFERKNKQLYAIVFYVSAFVSIIFTIFGDWIVQILYGNEFAPAVGPLRIITWYTAFSYLGVARNAWIVCENKQKYLKYLYLSAAILNVFLNLLLIPTFKASGAAMASLITQISTSILLPLFIPDLKPNARLMLEAIRLKF
ncbi:colanic acid exporter [Clostridiales bacterium CHKCI006]|nr:colanic acid exporter [Clostridiales bacterium CHKCI006]